MAEPTKVSGGKSKYSQTKSNLQNPISKEDTHTERGYGVSRKDKDHYVGIVHPVFYLDAYYKQVTPANPVQNTQLTNWTNKGTLSNQFVAIAASTSVVYTEEYQTPFIKFGGAVPTFNISGSTALFNFIHTAGGEYTIYVVMKNTVNENVGGLKVISINRSNSVQNGYTLSIINDGDNRLIAYNVGNASTSVFKPNDSSGIWVSNSLYNRRDDVAPYIISICCRNINQIGAVCGGLYVNGLMVRELVQQALFGTGNAATNFVIGDRTLGGNDLNSSIGELAIFNTMHDQTTHNYNIQMLKEKYRI